MNKVHNKVPVKFVEFTLRTNGKTVAKTSREWGNRDKNIVFFNVLFQFSFTITFRVAQWLMYIRIICVDLCVESLLRYYVNHFVSPSPICC